jgi:hypothetical protein
MKRIISAAAIALAFTVAAGAQTPESQSPTTTKKSAKAGKMSSKPVTLTGCLREGETPDTFALDNVQASETTGMEHKGTAGGTATATSPAVAEDMGQVKLVSTADISLKEHVGHKVQVSGTMTGAMMKDKSSSSATGTSGAATDKDKGAHTLKVRSLRHISETCTP